MTGRTLRIAFVTGHYLPFAGGVESHVEQIARRLAARGHRVEVFTQTDDPGWPAVEEIDGVRVQRERVPLPSEHLAVAPGLRRALRARAGDFDVFHAHGYHSAAPLLAVAAGVAPLVFTPHYHGTGHSPLRKLMHKPYRLIGHWIYEKSDHVICVSRAEADLLTSHFPFVEEKLTVIPNGVDLSALQGATPMELDGTLVVSAGRLEVYKGVDRTISAFTRLDPSYTLVITGDGSDRTRLEKLSADLGLQDQVRFLGRVPVDELYRWFQRADVYVSMSSNEAMPVTIVEMLAAGTRVVASDIPAHRDIRAFTRGQVTLAPLDVEPQTLATAIEAAAATPPANDQRIPTWDEVTDATLAVYTDAVAHG